MVCLTSQNLFKIYPCYYELISKFNVGQISLQSSKPRSGFNQIDISLAPGTLEPEFNGDLSVQYIQILSHYKKIGYNSNALQQTACLVANPITVGNIALLFNYSLVSQTSDSMTILT